MRFLITDKTGSSNKLRVWDLEKMKERLRKLEETSEQLLTQDDFEEKFFISAELEAVGLLWEAEPLEVSDGYVLEIWTADCLDYEYLQ